METLPVNNQLFTPDDQQHIDHEYRQLVAAYLNSNHRKNIEIIERAYSFATRAHQGVRRRSGEPYILHPIAVARIVISEFGLGSTSICAALLHDVVEDTEYTIEDLEVAFGSKIARIVEGLTKISGGIFGTRASLQAENFRKLLLSMSTDVRVVLIKMADRLHNMRTLGSLRPEKQFKIAGETLYIYAPLADRLGLYKTKLELEDLAFKYEHPARHAEIMRQVEQSEAKRAELVEEFVAPVRRKLDEAGFSYEIKARVKSAYSIYKKMERKQLPFHEIYDVYAVRVIFDNPDNEDESVLCYKISKYFMENHKEHPGRHRDWTVTPKPNGYRALHITVMGPEGRWVEVQIRSRKMDEVAEMGYAAHWKYKTGEYDSEKRLDDLMLKVKDILADPNPDALDFLDSVKLNLFSADIYVFTPKGDLITLPSGSTVLDMAFAIHTHIGQHCVAGKIGHKLVDMSYELHSGDQVEIITSEAQTPTVAWLTACRTAKAKNALRSLLRRDKTALIAHGKTLYQEFLHTEELEDTPDLLEQVLAHYNLKGSDDLYLMLANDEINLDSALRGGRPRSRSRTGLLGVLLRNPFASRRKDGTRDARQQVVDCSETYVLLPGANPPNYQLESCCLPIPGDDVLGFVNADGQVVLHKADCPQAARLKTTYGTRLVATRWEGSADNFFVTLTVDGIDRPGMLEDMVHFISATMKLNIRAMNISALHEVFHCSLSLRVDNTDTVERLCRGLRNIKGIKFARRTS